MSILHPLPARRASSPRPPRLAAVARLCAALTAAALAPIAALGAQQLAPPAAADSLRGTVTLAGVVRDTAGRVLSGAEVRAGVDQFTITGADGQFVLQGVAPDTIQLLVRRIGYLPANVVLEAKAGLRVELAVTLMPAVTELGTITVEGRKMDTRLWQSGFYQRAKLGWGTFFSPDELDHYGATLSSLVREVPSVRVVHGLYGSAVAYGPGNVGGSCPLMVFLDGVYIRWAGDVGLDQLVNRQDVLAVEVYARATEVPSRLSGYGGVSGSGGLPSPGGGVNVGPVDCGAIAIWTKPF